jgi:hypothetical protein
MLPAAAALIDDQPKAGSPCHRYMPGNPACRKNSRLAGFLDGSGGDVAICDLPNACDPDLAYG